MRGLEGLSVIEAAFADGVPVEWRVSGPGPGQMKAAQNLIAECMISQPESRPQLWQVRETVVSFAAPARRAKPASGY